MPALAEPLNLGDLLKYEAPNLYSRDRVTVASGQNLPLGTVVGIVTGGGSGHEPAFLGYVGEHLLDAVAVGKGPGSYTGLRIGVSFAKGLCYGLRIPLVAIGSLDALTEVAKEDYEAGILSVDRWEEACLCPMVDARRMEVYTRVFDAAGTPLSDVSAEVVTAESFAAWRGDGRPFVIFGNGAAKCAGLLPDATLIQVAPSARGLARLAQEALDAGRTEDIAYFEPFYLKDFVVTRSKKKLF